MAQDVSCQLCLNQTSRQIGQQGPRFHCTKCMGNSVVHQPTELYCELCLRHVARRIADAIKYDDVDPLKTARSDFWIRVELKYRKEYGLFVTLDDLDGKASTLGQPSRLFSVETVPEQDSDHTKLETSETTQKHGILPDCKPPDLDNSSLRAVQQMKLWLEACNAHGCCPVSTGFLPTRLIEIVSTQGGARLRLVETKHTTTPSINYAALTYCWGGPQPAQTVMANLRKRLEALEESELPATIRDAIAVCRHLGIMFLWVDSLCINQDLKEEKHTEISMMDRVYANAYLTISASRAAAAVEGFLGLPKTDWKVPSRWWRKDNIPENPPDAVAVSGLQVDLDLHDQGEYVGTIKLRETRFDTAEWVPILQRAWAYQEKALSRRILSFGYQIEWTCRKGYQIDTGYGSVSSNPESPDEISLIWRPIGHLLNPTSMALNTDQFEKPDEARTPGNINITLLDLNVDPAQSMGLWNAIVHQYASRQLSFEQDRLPALAGLATRFAMIDTEDEYMAGLWKSHFPNCLLWGEIPKGMLETCGAGPSRHTADNPLDGKCRETGLSPRWVGPTWSWISLPLPKGLAFFGYGKRGEPITKLICYTARRPQGASPYGQLEGASLSVLGRLGKTTCRWMIPKKSNSDWYEYTFSRRGLIPIRLRYGPEGFLDEDMFPECVRSAIPSEGMNGHTHILMGFDTKLNIVLDQHKMYETTRLIEPAAQDSSEGGPLQKYVHMTSPVWLLPLTEMVISPEEDGEGQVESDTQVRSWIRGLVLMPKEVNSFQRIGHFEGKNLFSREDIIWNDSGTIRII
ncbi:uncharacterized protein E0L32_007923 [Thyridium curvatum]|uniref:Heterokaryon incompatibility domain-containing protein n=1 Tax=Thyridium curvatum TaxID=1093900 RepID=A0A507AMJ0_9PEZI|nr:uncharacterized protein E0L32_007923 [Thyridium curvatum]TPX11062.1 hypothetical protein E0L32_007923 [Thyridium curvatum]